MRKCPECGTQIEDGLKACPNCGYPMPNNYNNQTATKEQSHFNGIAVIQWFVSILLIVGIVYLFYNVSENKNKIEAVIYEINKLILDPSEYSGNYTIVDMNGDKHSLILEDSGTAILANYKERSGSGYTWDIKQWNGQSYVILHGTSKLVQNLYMIDTHIYDNEFDMRRQSDRYIYVIREHK